MTPASPPSLPGECSADAQTGNVGIGGESRAAPGPLAGMGVLVTRPQEQAGGLIRDLQSIGARPILFPALAILPPRDPSLMHTVIHELDSFDLAVFISPTSAERCMAAIRNTVAWPHALPVAAVGKGTAKTLQDLGFPEVLQPTSGADSEHLLALSQLQDMSGKSVVIFRGEGGRELIADTLRQRGAQITYAECYRRGLPVEADAQTILDMFAAGEIKAVTVYSIETLDNLLQLLGAAGKAYLQQTPLFVPHPRIADHALTQGFQHVPTRDGRVAGRNTTGGPACGILCP